MDRSTAATPKHRAGTGGPALTSIEVAARPHGVPPLVALRARTRDAHEQLERALVIGAHDAGREEYALHVAALWGWMTPTESLLWRGPWSARIDAEARAVKASWLATDIAAARADGMLGHAIEVGAPLKCGSMAARYGLAYVIEGSMLGGAVLWRRLGARLAPWPARYLRGYGLDGPRYWRGLLAAMNEEVVAACDIDEAADAALEAFRSLERWLRSQRAAG